MENIGNIGYNARPGSVSDESHVTGMGRKVVVVKSINDLRNLQRTNSAGSHHHIEHGGVILQNRLMEGGRIHQGHLVQSSMPSNHGQIMEHSPASQAHQGGFEASSDQYNPATETVQQEQEEEVPEVDITVNNVVCSFSIRCHINLKTVAMEGCNVIYKRENNVSISSTFISLPQDWSEVDNITQNEQSKFMGR